MIRNRRIGFIIPAIIDQLEATLLSEVHMQASQRGYDLIVITNSSNTIDDFPVTDYTTGEERIYNLITHAEFDGFLFAAGRFFSKRMIHQIHGLIKSTGIPCVVLEKELDGFPHVYTNQRDDMFHITEHLITAHGLKHIFCLTGPQGVHEAEERLEGFRDAMNKYGLRSDRFAYGDFWRNSPRELAADIVSGKIEMPEAVVCTNDTMAVTLCEMFKSYHINVPAQIAVTGYDGSLEALSYDPVITTVVGKECELAYEAVTALHDLICHTNTPHSFKRPFSLRLGESCGCLPKINDHNEKIDMYQMVIRSRTPEEMYLNSNLMACMSENDTIDEFAAAIHRLTYLLPTSQQIDICLCTDWTDLSNQKHDPYRRNSYTDKMYMLLSKKHFLAQPDNYQFDTYSLLPELSKPHEPLCSVLLPIHYNLCNLGYIALYYEKGGDYHIDMFLQYWRDSLANGLYTLSNKMYMERMNHILEEYSVRDQLTGMLNKKGFIKKSAEYLRASGNSCLMFIISYSQPSISINQKCTADDIVVANSLSLLCSEGKLCARIGSKTYAALQRFNEGENETETANQFLVSLEQMMQRLKGQPILPDIPDMNCDYLLISMETQITDMLDSLKNGTTDNSVKSAVNDYSTALKHVRRDMYLSPQVDWTSDSISKRLGISSGYFRKIYKEQFNVAFNEDHIIARISKAKELLKGTNLHIGEIAAQCGFKNSTHFMRMFKLREGKTAVQYRRER